MQPDGTYNKVVISVKALKENSVSFYMFLCPYLNVLKNKQHQATRFRSLQKLFGMLARNAHKLRTCRREAVRMSKMALRIYK